MQDTRPSILGSFPLLRLFLVSVAVGILVSFALCWKLEKTNPVAAEILTKLILFGFTGLAAVLYGAEKLTGKRLRKELIIGATGGLMLVIGLFASIRDSTLFRTELRITGQVLAQVNSNWSAVPGASIYFLPAKYATEWELQEHIRQSESGAAMKDSCSNVFFYLIKEHTGLSRPLDAKLHPVKRVWEEITSDPRWEKATPDVQARIRDGFWKEKVLVNSEFANLAPDELAKYREELFVKDQREQMAFQKLHELPKFTTDSHGEFVAKIQKGNYLVVASGNVDRDEYVWALPSTLNDETRLVLTGTVCDPRVLSSARWRK